MNIKYHLATGLILDLAFHTRGVMTIASILPDTPLILNEIKLWKNNEKFSAEKVHPLILNAYFCTHSLWFSGLTLFLGLPFFAGYLIHIICDWFTHTGIFASRPIYPAPFKIKFGKDILK